MQLKMGYLFQCLPLLIAWYLKAFALTGRQVCVRNYPGRCPGLGASALSGRVGLNLRNSSSSVYLRYLFPYKSHYWLRL